MILSMMRAMAPSPVTLQAVPNLSMAMRHKCLRLLVVLMMLLSVS